MPSIWRLSDLAATLCVPLQGPHGCGNWEITGVASLDAAKQGQASFLTHPSYAVFLATTKASVVVLSPSDTEGCPETTAQLIAEHPRLCWAKLAALFQPAPNVSPGIHPTAIIAEGAYIDPSATIGAGCVIDQGAYIGPQVFLGPHTIVGTKSRIGAHSHLFPRVTLYANVTIGKHAIIHSGAVLGADGFGFVHNTDQEWVPIPQLGGLTLGDYVEIGANSTIDRGTLGDTVIEKGVKIDNLVQIGHNVRLGAHTIVAGAAAIAGSVNVGCHCMVGGGVGIVQHVTIADGTVLTARTLVTHSINKPEVYSSGTGMQTNRLWRKNVARFRRLDDIARRFLLLEKKYEQHVAERN